MVEELEHPAIGTNVGYDAQVLTYLTVVEMHRRWKPCSFTMEIIDIIMSTLCPQASQLSFLSLPTLIIIDSIRTGFLDYDKFLFFT